jgi:catechol 2,3-dioxygenase-like lactoylglutathione lyase family enzyme
MNPTKLDHVAYWVAERRPIADFATAHLGMHVIDQTERFTLLGSNARRGKITLFDAEGPRERGALGHVAFRVNDLAAALAQLPDDLAIDQPRPTEAYFDVTEGVRFGLVEAETDVDYDLDHVALWSAVPEVTARQYLRYGFAAAGPTRVEVGGAYVELHEGDPSPNERPLLNHLAVLVDSADEIVQDANELAIEVESVVDAANTYAAFLWGPDRVRIEYVEHKPTFSLT